jgi:hypothetical protein
MTTSSTPLNMLELTSPQPNDAVVMVDDTQLGLFSAAVTRNVIARLVGLSFDPNSGLMRVIKSDGSVSVLSGFITDNVASDTVLNPFVGDKGAIGESGIDALDGRPGRRGPAGCVGVRGDPGPKGQVGARGRLGIPGDTGLSLGIGDPGPKGWTGRTGPVGETGADGEQGRIGPAGNRGIKGIIGDDGIIGPIGDRGCVGIMGPDGIRGDQGSIGSRGPTGRTGDFGELNERQGGNGARGEDGPITSIVGGCNITTEWVPDCAGRYNSILISAPDGCKPCADGCVTTTTTKMCEITTSPWCEEVCGGRVNVFIEAMDNEGGEDGGSSTTHEFKTGGATMVKVVYYFEDVPTRIQVEGGRGVDFPTGDGQFMSPVPGGGKMKVTVSANEGQQVSGYYIVYCFDLRCNDEWEVKIPACKVPPPCPQVIDEAIYYVGKAEQLIKLEYDYTKPPSRIEMRQDGKLIKFIDNPPLKGVLSAFLDTNATGFISILSISNGEAVEGKIKVTCIVLYCGDTYEVKIPAGAPTVEEVVYNVGKVKHYIKLNYDFKKSPKRIELRDRGVTVKFKNNPVKGFLSAYLDTTDDGKVTVAIITNGEEVEGTIQIQCFMLTCNSKYDVMIDSDTPPQPYTEEVVFTTNKTDMLVKLKYEFTKSPKRIELRHAGNLVAAVDHPTSGFLSAYLDMTLTGEVSVLIITDGEAVEGWIKLECYNLWCGSQYAVDIQAPGDGQPYVDTAVFKVSKNKQLISINFDFIKPPIRIEMIVNGFVVAFFDNPTKGILSHFVDATADGKVTVKLYSNGGPILGYYEVTCKLLACNDDVKVNIPAGQPHQEQESIFQVGNRPRLIKVPYRFTKSPTRIELRHLGQLLDFKDSPTTGFLSAFVKLTQLDEYISVIVISDGQEVVGDYTVQCFDLSCGSMYSLHFAPGEPRTETVVFNVGRRNQYITVPYDFSPSPARIELRYAGELLDFADNPSSGQLSAQVDTGNEGDISVVVIGNGSEVTGTFSVQCQIMACGSKIHVKIPAGESITKDYAFDVGFLNQNIEAIYKFTASPSRLELVHANSVIDSADNPVEGKLAARVDSRDDGQVIVSVITHGEAVEGDTTLNCFNMACGSTYKVKTARGDTLPLEILFYLGTHNTMAKVTYSFTKPPKSFALLGCGAAVNRTTNLSSGVVNFPIDAGTSIQETQACELVVKLDTDGQEVEGEITVDCYALECGDTVDVDTEAGDLQPQLYIFDLGVASGTRSIKVNYEFSAPVNLQLGPSSAETAKKLNTSSGTLSAPMDIQATGSKATVLLTPLGGAVKGEFTLLCLEGVAIEATGEITCSIAGGEIESTVEFHGIKGEPGYTVTLVSGELPKDLVWVDGHDDVPAKITGHSHAYGWYDLMVKVVDSTGQEAIQPFDILIKQGVCVIDLERTGVKEILCGITDVDELYKGLNGTPPYVITHVSGDLPPDLIFTSGAEGKLTGIPRTFGKFPIVIRAVDSNQLEVQKQYVLDILPGDCLGLDIDQQEVEWKCGATDDLTQTYTGSHGKPPYWISFVSGTLPKKLVWTDGVVGTVSGKAEEYGNWTIFLSIRDADGKTAQKEFTVHVEQGSCVGTTTTSVGLTTTTTTGLTTSTTTGLTTSTTTGITTTPHLGTTTSTTSRIPCSLSLPILKFNYILRQQVDIYPASLINGKGPYDWQVTGLPDGLTADWGDPPNNYLLHISGTATPAGIYNVHIDVIDANGCQGIGSFIIEITGPTTTTGLTTPSVCRYTRGANITIPVNVAILPAYPVIGSMSGGSPKYTYQVNNIPQGCTWAMEGENQQRIVLKGTPVTPGVYTVKVFGYDSKGCSGTDSTIITVTEQMTTTTTTVAPCDMISSTTDPKPTYTVVEGSSVSITSPYSMVKGYPPYNWTVSGLPVGLSWAKSPNPSSNISVTGFAGTPGTYPITVTGQDTHGCTKTGVFTIVITPKPTKPPCALTIIGGVENEDKVRVITLNELVPVSQLSIAQMSEGIRPYRWSVAGLPQGLNWASVGSYNEVLQIGGVPTLPGIYPVDIVGYDNANCQSAGKIIIVVTAVPPCDLNVAGALAPDGNYGIVGREEDIIPAGKWLATMTNGHPPYTWSITGMPADTRYAISGAKNETVTFSGTYLKKGLYTVTVTATDKKGCTKTKTIVFNIAEWPPCRITAETALISVKEESPITGRWIATMYDGHPPYTWTITDLPPGMTSAVSGTSATISGTCKVPGTYRIKIHTVDKKGCIVDAEVVVEITALPPCVVTVSGLSIDPDTGAQFLSWTEDQLLSSANGLVIARDGKPPYTWGGVSGLPPGVTTQQGGTNNSTLQFIGTPTVPGTYTVNFSATESRGRTCCGDTGGGCSVTIVVKALPPLDITPHDSPYTVMEQSIESGLLLGTTINGHPAYTTSISGGLPPGTSSYIDGTKNQNFKLKGTYTTPGTYTLTLTAVDRKGETATKTVVIIVQKLPPIDVVPKLPEKITRTVDDVDTRLNIATITKGKPAYTWAVTGVPPALTASYTGVNNVNLELSGTYTTPGTYTVTMTGTDAYGDTDTETLIIEVLPFPPPVIKCSDRTFQEESDIGLADIAVVSSGKAPYTTTLSSVPPGLVSRLSATGNVAYLSGTPTVPGVYPITVSSTDGKGVTVSCVATITVEKYPDIKARCSDYSFNEGTTYSAGYMTWLAVASYGLQLPYHWSYTGALPPNATLKELGGDNNRLDLHWAGGEAINPGSYPITVTVTDGKNRTASCTATITIVKFPDLEVVCDETTIQEGGDLSINTDWVARATHQWPTGDCTWTISGLPAGVSYHSYATQKAYVDLDGIPTGAGVYPITLTVTDAKGRTASCTTTFTVTPYPTLTLHCYDQSREVASEFNGSTLASASNGWGLPYTWNVAGLPPSTNYDLYGSSSIVIRGASNSAGMYPVSITVTDQKGRSASCTAMVEVKPKPPLTLNCYSPTITEDSPYDYYLNSGIGGSPVAPISWNISGSVPGMSITETGTAYVGFKGAPTDPGTYSINLTATDVTGRTASCTATVTVDARPRLSLDCASSQSAINSSDHTVDDNYYVGLGSARNALGGQYTWNRDEISAALPPGLTLTTDSGNSSYMHASGTLTQAGTYYIPIRVSDASGDSQSCTISITVLPPHLNVYCSPNIGMGVNSVGSFTVGQVTVASKYLPVSWSVNVPFGDVQTTNTAATMVIRSGNKLPKGTHSYSVTATDNRGVSGSCSGTIKVS